MIHPARLGFHDVRDFMADELRILSGESTEDTIDVLDWTLARRPFLIPERRFSLTDHKYLEGIYRCKAKQMVVCKSSQMGISEYLLSYVLHGCDTRNATCLYIFPNDGLISDFSTARLGPAIEVSDYLGSIVHDHTGKEGKKGANRVTLKRIRNRFLYLRGGQVKPDGRSPGLKSVDSDIIVIDELNECDPRVKDIAVKRLGHSQIAEIRLVSTPTYPGIGIHAEYLLSDQRQWFIPCPSCGKRQSVSIDNIVTEYNESKRPSAWHTIDGKAFAACESCKQPLDLLADGEWIATYPEREIAGFHVTKFHGPVCDLDAIIEGLQSYNATKIRETYNQDLGIPYVTEGGQLTDTVLDATRREYIHGKQGGKRCYAGIDVGSVLHMVIRQEPDSETGERRQLFAGEVSWEEAGRQLRIFDPVTTVIDGLPETKQARDFQDSFQRGKVWLCYYGDSSGTNQKDQYALWKHAEGTIIADRTRSLDEMYARVQEGKNTLPGNARDIPRYYDQLKAPVRTTEKTARGIETIRYVESSPDHWSHAENYVALASLRARASGTAGKLDY